MTIRSCLLFGLALLFVPSAASATVLTLTTSNRDTTIMKGNLNNSSGGQQLIYAGTNGNTGSADRAMFSFDLTTIPSTSVVQSVQLTLTLSMAAGSGMMGMTDTTSRVLSLHGVTDSWGEGTVSLGGGQGNPANAGDATWNARSFGSTSWTTAGGDFHSSVSGAQLISNVANVAYTWDSTATTLNDGSTPTNNSLMASDVQGWVNNSASNFGWILNNSDETDARTFRAFYSRESIISVPGFQPTLTITYVPEPSSFAIMVLGSFGFGAVVWRRKR